MSTSWPTPIWAGSSNMMRSMLAPYNMRWVEEPVIYGDLHSPCAELKAKHRQHLGRQTRIHDPRLPRRPRSQGLRIADMCEANDLLVIPHAGQMHNYHITMSSYAGPISEYFPKVPVEVGNELFWFSI